jgi:hypothetical protein
MNEAGCLKRDNVYYLIQLLCLQDTAASLRARHRLMGTFTGRRRPGTKAAPTMPILLLDEEAALAIKRGWAHLVRLSDAESSHQTGSYQPLCAGSEHGCAQVSDIYIFFAMYTIHRSRHERAHTYMHACIHACKLI